MQTAASTDYARVERAILFLDAERVRRPGLGEVAAHVGLSAFHFQRLFRRWAGVSPKRFLQFFTAEQARQLLRDPARRPLDVAYDVGLSGPGRLHDLLVSVHAVTPGEAKGLPLSIAYGVHKSPFGTCLIATTARGICGLAFTPAGGERAAVEDLRERWPRAAWRRDDAATSPLVRRIFEPVWAGGERRRGAPGRAAGRADGRPLPLFLVGTNFQLQVWQALLDIAPGSLTSYGRLAAHMGAPRAVRAVGTAVGANPIAYLIPCHRVIRETGAFGEYRWGAPRKKALLAWESCAREKAAADARTRYS